MAQTLGELVLKLQLDQAQFNTQLKKVEANVKNTQTNFGGLATAMKALPFALIAAGMLQIGKSIAKASSDAQETQQKFNVVFSGIQVQAEETAQRLSAAFRLADQTSKELLSSTANILQSFGFAGDKSLEFSEQIVSLSADLVSFTNSSMGVEGAVNAITKSFLGEAEQLKSLGKIALIEYLQPIAKAQGKNIETMTRQERAQFTFNEILKQSKNEVGDYARSWQSPANILRAVQERFKDIEKVAGDQLTPSLATLGTAFLQMTEEGGILSDGLTIIAKSMSAIINAITVFTSAAGLAKNFIDGADASNKADLAFRKQAEGIESLQNKYKDYMKEGEGVKQTLERLQKTSKDVNIQLNTKMDLEQIKGWNAAIGDSTDKTRNLDKSNENLIKNIESINFQNDKLKQKVTENTGKMREQTTQAQAAAASYASTIEKLKQLQAKASGDQIVEIQANAQKQRNEFKKSFGETSALYREAIGYIDKIEKDDIFKARVEGINKYFQAFGAGIVDIFSSIQQLQAATGQAAIAALDEEKQARYEAAGVAEDTEVMKASAELAEAEATGNAILIGEKKRILDKAKIDEEYAKKKSQLEYKNAMDSWTIQVTMATAQMAMGIMNAFASGASIPYVGAAVGAAYAAIAAAAGAVQLAAVIAAKPRAPRFEEGGIVGGNLMSGDNIVARLNSSEMVLTQQQQANLFKQANVDDGGDRTMHAVFNMDGRTLFEAITKATFDKKVLVFSGSVV